MTTLASNKKIVNFQADRDLADEAKKILESQNTTMSKTLNLFLKNIVVTKKIDLLTEDELEKEELFRQLQAEVQAAYTELEAGKYYKDEDLAERYGL